MTERWKLMVFIAMNLVLPYSGSFAAGRVRLVAILPILFAYLLAFQRYDVLFDIVYVRHLWFMTSVLSAGLFLHSVWLLLGSQEHRSRYWPILAFAAAAALAILFEDDDSYMFRVDAPAAGPFPEGAVLVARERDVAPGDLVAGRDDNGVVRYGIHGGASAAALAECSTKYDGPLSAARKVNQVFLRAGWVELPKSPEEACARL